MKGIALAEQLFEQHGRQMLKSRFSDYCGRIAAGLVGEGSECFGFDDQLSRDHDWVPGFCLWLNRDDYNRIGRELQRAYDDLVARFSENGFIGTGQSSRRRGVFESGQFYRRFINRSTIPENQIEWLKIPEEYLAVCTNGKVFYDSGNSFSKFRKELLEFYPEDIRKKKIAARCVSMAQDGQYNYSRSLGRGDMVAANHAVSRFINAAVSVVFLLKKKYKPFYKWMHRSLALLKKPGPEIAALLEQMVVPLESESLSQWNRRRSDCIEQVASLVIAEFRKQGLSSSSSSFLLKHAPVIHSNIMDSAVSRLPLGTG